MLRRLPFLAAFALACADPSGPSTHTHQQRVLVAGTEEGAVVVDLDWRGIVRRSGPRMVAHGPAVLNGRGELFTVGRIDGGGGLPLGHDVGRKHFRQLAVHRYSSGELTRGREAFGRAAEPWEVANVMVFLASDYSSYMTGEVVSVSSQHA